MESEVKRSLDVSPGKSRYGDQGQTKKKTKVLRKGIATHTSAPFKPGQVASAQMIVTKSLDRVPSKKNTA